MPTAPLRLPCHPEHLSSGRREPPSHTQPRKQAAAKESDPWAESRSCHRNRSWGGVGRQGEPLISGETSYRRCPEQQLESRDPEGGPWKAGTTWVIPLNHGVPWTMHCQGQRFAGCPANAGQGVLSLQCSRSGPSVSTLGGSLGPRHLSSRVTPLRALLSSCCFSQGKEPSLPKITQWQGLSLREPLGPGHLLGHPNLWVGAKGAGAGPTRVGIIQHLAGPNLKSQFHP